MGTTVSPKKVMVKDFAVGKNHFALVQLTNGDFGAVDYKYIKNGKTTKVLNGLELRMASTLEDVIKKITFEAKFAEMMESGMELSEIVKAMANR